MTREHRRKAPAKHPEKDPPHQAELLSKIEDEWLTSRALGNPALTQQLLDDDYIGTNSDGAIQNKADFIRSIETAVMSPAQAEHEERSIRVYGNVAVSMGRVTKRSPQRQHSYRYIRFFRKTSGEWRLVASQSTRLPGA